MPAKSKAKPKDPPVNKIVIKEPTPPPTPPPSPPPTPPPSPPPLERFPKKRNPPHYKQKMAILQILQQKYKVDAEIIADIAELFHLFGRVSLLDTYKN